MALDFPNAPSNGQKFPASPIAGIPTYTWDGEKWTTAGPAVGSFYVAKSGDTMSGHLSLITAPAAANAVRKDYVDGADIILQTNINAKADSSALPVAATSVEYINNSAPTKMLTSGATWGAAAPIALSGTTVAPDFSTGLDFTWTLSANSTLNNPTNGKAGQKGLIYLTPATFNITTWGSMWKFPGGTKPTPTIGGLDVISYAYNGSVCICSFTGDFK